VVNRLVVKPLDRAWLGVRDPVVERPFLAEVREAADGRIEVVAAYFPKFSRGSWGPLTNDVFRSVSLTRVEAVINQRPEVAEVLNIFRAKVKPATDLEAMGERFFDMLNELDERDGRQHRRSLRLPVPASKRFPDSFYERLAELYLDLVARGEAPIVALAEANERPYKTVAAWIREARRRGQLPAGRAGRAG
jgi:hypothetical protein